MEQENLYRTILYSIGDAVVVTDREGMIRQLNPAAEKLTGWAENDALGKPLAAVFNIIDEKTRKPVEIPQDKLLQQGRLVELSDQIVLVTKHGVEVPIADSGAPVKNDSGEITGAVFIFMDISERREARKALQYQFQFEKMVAEISASFVGTPVEKIDAAVDYALKESGEFFKADRSFLFLFSDDSRFMTNTHEWCAPGISSQQERNQDYFVDQNRWWAQELFRGKHVHIPDVEALPAEMEKDKQEFQAEEIRSCLSIPLIKGGQTFGYFGFDGVKKKKSWTDEQIALLKVVAEIIAGAIVKAETEEALKESEERYREILSTIEEGYYEADLVGRITYCNEAACRLFGGYSINELVGMSYKRLYKNPRTAFEAYNRVFTTGIPERGLILEMVRRDGSNGFAEISISLIKDKSGNVTGFKGIGRDITKRVEYEQNLEFMSLHDRLTGIYNRTYFETELDRLDGSREYPITIISADLDGLKLVNDTLGHEAGDRLLEKCASILKKSLRRSDILARVGGDEFSAILPHTDKEKGAKILRRIRKNTRAYNKSDEVLPMGISLGVATAEKSDASLKELFKRADDLMYTDKLFRSGNTRSQIVNGLLADLEEKDYLSDGHANRLEEHCLAVGRKIGLSSYKLSDLGLFARVHDLGKVTIPEKILFIPGPLTEEEWEIMRGHPEKGFRIASSSPNLDRVAELILKHHERWDGAGYPLGLKKTEIPVECRILAIADAFDAMTNKRLYNEVKTESEAIEELKKHSGTQFDPKLVQVFLAVLKEKGREKVGEQST